jgi:hypothetical protein
MFIYILYILYTNKHREKERERERERERESYVLSDEFI